MPEASSQTLIAVSLFAAFVYGFTIYRLLKLNMNRQQRMLWLLYIVFLPFLGIILFWIKIFFFNPSKRENL